jgi:Cd2+/Zn2+-exporting ATPase
VKVAEGVARENTGARLLTPERQREAARIVLVGVLTFLYWRELLPFPILVVTLGLGLYPLAKTGVV